jgi:outer membrane protein assembly factor BamB
MNNILIFFLLTIILSSCSYKTNKSTGEKPDSLKIKDSLELIKKDSILKAAQDTSEIKFIIQTFRGNWQRNYYGDSLPLELNIIWKLFLGSGMTVHKGPWYGAGWTGQPLLVKEKGELYLLQGAFDYNLKKIVAETGEIIWQYKFDDVLKGTGTLCFNNNTSVEDEKYIVIQGSRKGYINQNGYSLRGISYTSGEELFRIFSRNTASYSRDCDGSPLVLNDTGYIGLENGIFTVFNIDYSKGEEKKKYTEPEIFQEFTLYEKSDMATHGGNLVTESSPCLLLNKIYITAGSGHVYGYNLDTREIDWDFFIGSDLDGSPVVTEDSCILIPVEKQYIKGRGGLLKLDPRKSEDESVVWWFPTKDFSFESWNGGIIGTPAVNDLTRKKNQPHLAVFNAIDGYMYVVKYDELDGDKALSFINKDFYPTPTLVYKYKTGPSISSPIIIGNRILSTGYGGIYLFEFDDELNFTLLDRKNYGCEASAISYHGKIYIASRDGNLYCLGN